MTSVKDSVKAQSMSAHISSWQKSGLSQAEYCRRNRITEQSFGYWLRKLRKQPSVELVPLNINPGFNDQQQLNPVLSGLSINFGGHATIEIARDFDAETFARVIRLVSAL